MADGRPTTYGKSGKVLHAQTREIIAKITSFMKSEAELYQRTHKVKIPITSYKQRVLAATGISEGSYKSIMKEAAKIASGVAHSFTTPRQYCNHKKDSDLNVTEEQHVVQNNNIVSPQFPMVQSYVLPNQPSQIGPLWIIPSLPLLIIKNNSTHVKNKIEQPKLQTQPFPCSNNIEEYHCRNCTYTNPFKTYLLYHEINEHSQKRKTVNRTFLNKLTRRLFKCSKCKKFRTSSNLVFLKHKLKKCNIRQFSPT